MLSLCLAPALIWWVLARHAGENGVARIGEDEVAVVVDYRTGTQRVVTTPGHRLFVPHFQEVFTFDRRPIDFFFQGNEPWEPNKFPRLTVRANDGSSLFFNQFTLQYALIPERAEDLLRDSGPGHAFKVRLVNGFARAVLRDELGRFSAEEIVLPESLEAAARRSKERLNELLAPHAVEVLEIATPKPRFPDEYEKAIERRKVANQEIEHLRGKHVQLEQEKEQRIARARREKETELRVLQGNLVRDLLTAEKNAVRVRRDADVYFMHRTGDAGSHRARMDQEAAALTARYTMEAEGLLAKAQALEAQGEQAVRAALIDRLPKIEFNLVPYSRDPSPQRVEHEQISQVRR
jgi:hypothetical protein